MTLTELFLSLFFPPAALSFTISCSPCSNHLQPAAAFRSWTAWGHTTPAAGWKSLLSPLFFPLTMKALYEHTVLPNIQSAALSYERQKQLVAPRPQIPPAFWTNQECMNTMKVDGVFTWWSFNYLNRTLCDRKKLDYNTETNMLLL